jgi:Arc/MetJ family transcription regulator
MATNLAIDDRLLDEALQIGGHRTKKATVTEALTEYIQRRKQARLIDRSARSSSTPSTPTKSRAGAREGTDRNRVSGDRAVRTF